ISILFVVFGVLGLVTQLFFVQKFVKYFGLKRALSVALFIVAVAFLLMFLSHSLLFFIIASVVLGTSNSLVQPLTQTILSKETDEKSQGSIMGLNASYMSIGQIFGPIIGGIVASLYIPLVFIAGIIFTVICFYLSFKVLKPGVPKEAAFA
ncbi:MAG TPA: MFS transporter, partial [Patescibacteria group bacterium]